MWIIKFIDGHKEIRWLKANNTYNFGRAEENDFILQSQAASRHQFSLHLEDINKENLYNCKHITELKLEIKSRAKTTVGNKILRLSKTDKVSMIHNLTNNIIELSVPKTVIESGSQLKKTEEDIKIILEWVPLCIFSTSERTTKEIENLARNGYDLRITNSPYVATHFCYNDRVSELDLEVAVVREIPILSQDWIEYIRNQKNSVKEWLLDLDENRFLPDSVKILPNYKRKTLFENITFVVFGKIDVKLKDLLEFLHGFILSLDIYSYFEEGKLLNSKLGNVLDNVKNSVILRVDESSMNKKFNINKDLEAFAKEANSTLITNDDIIKCINDCNLEKLQTLELINSKRPPKKKRKYEKRSKVDFLDFSSPINTQIIVPSKESVIKSAKNNVGNPKDKSPEDLENFQKLSVKNSQIKDEISNSTLLPLNGKKEEVYEEVSNPELTKGPNSYDNDSLNMKTSASVIKKNESLGDLQLKFKSEIDFQLDQEEIHKFDKQPKSTFKYEYSKRNFETMDVDSEYNDKGIKSRKINPPLSLANAIKLTKEKAEKSVSLDLDDNEIDVALNKDLTDLSIVEIVEIKPRVKKPDVLEEGKHTNRKNFKKFTKNCKLKPNITRTYVPMSNVTIENDYKFVDINNFENNDCVEMEVKIAEDFKDEIGDVKNYVNTEREEGLFVSIDSQDDNDEDEEEAENSKFSFGGTNLINPHSKNSNIANDQIQKENIVNNYNNENDENDDDDDDDEQFKFGFSR